MAINTVNVKHLWYIKVGDGRMAIHTLNEKYSWYNVFIAAYAAEGEESW